MLLAVDTSTPQIGLALYDGSQVLAESIWISKGRHSQELAPGVVYMLERIGASIDQVKALAVALGPGSFTALRVGLSFVKGLALANSLPVIGINTLDVIAASQALNPSQPLVCVLPAGRGRLAVGWYAWQNTSENHWSSSNKAVIMTAEALAHSITRECVVCGDLAPIERQLLMDNPLIGLVSPARATRRPALLAELAFQRWQRGEVDDLSSLSPIYLHLADPIPDFKPL